MAFSQSDEKKQKQRHGRMIRKSLLKQANEYRDDEIMGSDTEHVDFNKEIHPLSYFINDREQMIEEMFSIVKEDQMRKMLPSSLKKYTYEELKAECMVHLLGMSKKRIFAILEGKNLNISSDSESEEEADSIKSFHEESQFSSSTNVKNIIKQDSSVKTMQNQIISSLSEDLDSTSNAISKTHNARSKEQKNIFSIAISDDSKDDLQIKKKKKKKQRKTKKLNSLKKHKIGKHKSNNVQPDDENEKSGKSLLEILELEMRARAIRALLKNTPNIDESVSLPPNHVLPTTNKEMKTAIDKTFSEVEKSCSVEDSMNDVEIQEVCPETVIIDDDDDEGNVECMKEIKSKSKQSTTKIPITGIDQEDTSNHSDVTPTEDIEIIFISDNESEAKENSNESQKAESDKTWSERWADSKKVKDVLTNSKLCANIRKRMRFAKMLGQKQSKDKEENNENTLQKDILEKLNSVEESTIAQFNLLKSLNKSDQLTEAQSQKPNTEERTTSQEEKVDKVGVDHDSEREKIVGKTTLEDMVDK